MQIGAKLKSLRKQRGIPLKELAEQTGLSIGFLSNIERNSTSPTLANLESIAKVLGVSLDQLFRQEDQSGVLRRNERPIIYDIPGKVRWEYIADGQKSVRVVCTTLYPHGNLFVSHGHSFEELGIVVRGAVQIMIGEKTHSLEEGDSVYVPPNLAHTAQNISDTECVCYWISATDRK